MENGFEQRSLKSADGLGLAFRDYGSRLAKRVPVLCLPGLTRNVKDFHHIATSMAAERRVLSLDARGRGRSDHDPQYSNYNLVTEVGDVLALISAELERPCIILGTSRGGLAAMVMGGVRPEMLAGVVLNDIGPVIEREGLVRIMGYLGIVPEKLDTWDDAREVMRAAGHPDFVGLSDADLMAWARRTFRDEDGEPAMDYDLKLRDAVIEGPQAAGDFWPQFRSLADKPLLVLRGENSNLLSAETVAEMRRMRPDMTAVTVRNRGHVPFLDEPEAESAILSFVRRVDEVEGVS